jgi:hypothetical protein
MDDGSFEPTTLVARRIRKFDAELGSPNGKQKITRHGSLPAVQDPRPLTDYRGSLRHISPSRHLSMKEFHVTPKLRNVRRRSQLSSRRSGSSPKSPGDSGRSSVTASKKLAGRERRISLELEIRKALRPLFLHACGHFEQVATVGIANGDAHEAVYHSAPDGSLVLVGPKLESSGQVRRKSVPFLCSDCGGKVRDELSKEFLAEALPPHRTVRDETHASNNHAVQVSPSRNDGVFSTQAEEQLSGNNLMRRQQVGRDDAPSAA